MHYPDPSEEKKPGKEVASSPPSHLNPQLDRRRKQDPSAAEFIERIKEGDRLMLGRAITLLESTLPEHRDKAEEILEACLSWRVDSIRIGITGAPGVGKSTFIESFGQYLIEQGRRLAILAVDPSSQLSKGSILGDKTRMPKLSADERAFIRPSPAGTSLGGVSQKTRESILLCEAAGYDTVLVETVGVGQSETAVHSMVDFFLLLLLPGAGDELQGIKRGIVEMADLIAVNKADGGQKEAARQAQRSYWNALHLLPPKESGWAPPILTCSALESIGIEPIWQAITAFGQQTRESGYFRRHRQEQARYWLKERIDHSLRSLFYQHPEVEKQYPEIETAVLEGRLSSFRAARKLLDLFIGRKKQ